MWCLVIWLASWLLLVEAQGGRPVNGTVLVPFNERTVGQLYFGLTLGLGTPPQNVSFGITSLGTSWVLKAGADFTNGSTPGFPDPTGGPFVFDADASSSLQVQKESVQSSYGFNTSIEGQRCQDAMSFGNVTGEGDFLYLVDESNRVPGDLDLGDVSSWLRNGNHTDQNVFSVWLNGSDSAPGEALFGGLDRRKLQGDLTVHYRSDRLNFLGEGDRNIYSMTALSISGGGEADIDLLSNHSAANFEVDYGDYLTWIPPDAFEAVAAALDGVRVVNYTSPTRNFSFVECVLVPCAEARRPLLLTFVLGTAQANTTLALPVSTLISSPETAQAQADLVPELAASGSDPALCLFYLAPGDRGHYFAAEHSVFTLGAMALRGLYTVFDRENATLATAPAAPADEARARPADVVRYDAGCVAGARYDNASRSPTCTPVATLLPTSLFTDAPTATGGASPSATSTSAADSIAGRLPRKAAGFVSLISLYLVVY